MTPEVKNKWTEALRSEKYEQGNGRLYNNGKYCCLGVLCDVMETPFVDKADARLYIFQEFDHEDHIGYLPDGAFGLPESTMFDLSEMNDFQRKNFKEIADWIDLNL